MDLGTALASSWSAGISLYAVAAVLGITGRLGWIEAPPFLEQPWVIAVAVALAVVDFVVDKIAVVDSVWDAVHLVIRPIGGALITASAPGQEIPLPLALGFGAVMALSSHSAKSSARLLVNASPEPVSNIVVSSVEDGIVGIVMALAIAYPAVAGVIAVVLAVACSITAVVFFKASRTAWRKIQARRAAKRAPPTSPWAGSP